MPNPPSFTPGKRDKREFREAKIKIPPPGAKREPTETSPLSFLLPAGFTIIGLIVMIVAASASDSGSTLLISMAISVPMMLGSYIVAYLNYRNGKRKYERDTQQREQRYQETLAQSRKDLQDLHEQTQTALAHNAPSPEKCLTIVQQRDPTRMWARQLYHTDFLSLRLGIGDMPSHIAIEVPEYSTGTERDPLIDEARSIKDAFACIKEVPISLPLAEAGVTGLCGERTEVLNAIRAVALQIATHHSPLDVKIVAVYPVHEAQAWGWLRWLPHTWSNERDQRYLACEKQAAQEMLSDLQFCLEQRQLQSEHGAPALRPRTHHPVYVFLLADPQLIEGEPILELLLKQAHTLFAYSIVLADSKGSLPSGCKTVVELKSGKGVIEIETESPKQRLPYTPDPVSADFADQFSRTLAPVQLKVEHKSGEIPTLVTLYDALGIQRPEELDMLALWQQHDPNDTMAVPVGRRAGGDLQYLDIQEPINQDSTIDRWIGPNALIAGTVGSGKSELLRALLISLAVHFHPHQAAFVLLDFKPPGLVDDFIRKLPHTINTITDLDIRRVPRALLSLQNELKHRMTLFEEASTRCGQPIRGLQDYMALYKQGLVSTPLPYLILVVDEFTRLKQELPDALDTFVKVAIVGRAFGFRMILATQRPAGVVTGDIETNTQLRMCLKVAKVEDSREIIGDEGAAYFTRAGRVRWRYSQQKPHEFQCAYTGADDEPPKATQSKEADVRLFTLDLEGKRKRLSQAQSETGQQSDKSQYEAIVNFIDAVARNKDIQHYPGVWLNPLSEKIECASLEIQTSWDGHQWQPTQRWLCPVIGELDDPAHQVQLPLEIDLATHGHLFVCAGTNSSTRLALRTLIEQLARDHPPTDVHFYFLDFGNAGLQIFKSLPHTGAIIRLKEPKRIKRLFGWLMVEMEQRRQWLDTCNCATLAEYRTSTQSAPHLPAIVIVLDNLGALKNEIDLIGTELTELTSRGGEVGIHLIISGDFNVNQSLISKPLNNIMALRLALQLDNPADYRVVVGEYPKDLFLPKDITGRGLCKGPAGVLECQIVTGEDDENLRLLVAEMKTAAPPEGPLPHPIQELPERVNLDKLLPGKTLSTWALHKAESPIRIPIGIEEKMLQALSADLESDGPHFLVTGPQQSGKTTLLQAWALALAETYPKELVQFEILDTVTGSLKPLCDLPHVRHYGASLPKYQIILKDLKQLIEEREEAAQRSTRPLIVVMVDDYQVLKQYSESVLNEIKEHASRGALWGIHVILAGNSALMSRWDPLPAQVLTSGSGVFIGSHDIPHDADFFDLMIPSPENKEKLPRGRGYFVCHKTPHLMQFAMPGDEKAIQGQVQRILDADRMRASSNETAFLTNADK